MPPVPGTVSDAPPAATVVQSDDQEPAIIVIPDIICSNGVIHIIDGLLIPPSLNDGNSLFALPSSIVSTLEEYGDGFTAFYSTLLRPNSSNNGLLLGDVSINSQGPYS